MSARGGGSLSQLVAANQSGPAAVGRVRARLRQDRDMSAGYLGTGFIVLGALLLVRGFASLAWSWSSEPSRPLSLVAWLLLVVVFVVSIVAARMNGSIIPGRISLLVPVVGVIAVVLDQSAFLTAPGYESLYPTATVGFGACLIVCLPFQPLRRSVYGAIALAVTGSVAVTTAWLVDPDNLAIGMTTLLLGIAPVVACILMLDVSDRNLGRRIDQAVTESLVDAPALGLGLTAASELRRLDGDAERLLASVATLPAGHPIDAATAARAARLGDQLRHALVADRTQSWLQIAVDESEHLRRTVRIIDPALVAARLSPERRRDLLALTWLCVAEAAAPGPVLDITFIPSPGGGADAGLAIAFSLVGTRRRGIDPTVWPLFSRLGRHSVDLAPDRALVVVEIG